MYENQGISDGEITKLIDVKNLMLKIGKYLLTLFRINSVKKILQEKDIDSKGCIVVSLPFF